MGKCNAVSGIYRVNLLLSSFGKLIHELVGKGLHFYESLFLRFYVAILWLVVRKKCVAIVARRTFFPFPLEMDVIIYLPKRRCKLCTNSKHRKYKESLYDEDVDSFIVLVHNFVKIYANGMHLHIK